MRTSPGSSSTSLSPSSSSSSSSPAAAAASSTVEKSWANRITFSTTSTLQSTPIPSMVSGTQTSGLTTPILSQRHQNNQDRVWPERLELRGTSPMSSRPPSSASSGSSTSNLARVHGHDHTRPLPPPRLPETISSTSVAPLTAPLTPISTSSSFRSRVPVTSSLNDSILSSTRSNDRTTQVGEVTLTVPRPDGERAVNEYVETPFRQPTPPSTLPSQKCLKNERRHHHHHHHHNLHSHDNHHHHPPHQSQQQQQKPNETRNNNNPTTRRNQQTLLQSSLPSSQPITKQPVSFTKEPANALGSGSLGLRPIDPSLSIMCDFCGRCRCESCREPPPLPSRWLCDNSCFCSAETALDYASCLCCVKGLFYHCADAGSGGDSEAGGSCADEPCSCSGSRKTARWACLAALTMVLPCLLCYWPLKGCVTLCETCYARHAVQGCRCDPNIRNSSLVSRDSRDPEKRLLDPVTPEL